MKKKFVAIMFTVAALSLVGCSSNDDSASNSSYDDSYTTNDSSDSDSSDSDSSSSSSSYDDDSDSDYSSSYSSSSDDEDSGSSYSSDSDSSYSSDTYSSSSDDTVTSYDATLEYGSGSVLVAISKDAMDRYMSALSNDNQGTIDEMENEGQIGWTSKGTKCNIVDRGIGTYQVKLLDGLYAGNTVYVISESVNEK